jgi:hypothetical protein
MNNNNAAQVSDDFGAFTAPDPVIAAEQKKQAQAKKEKGTKTATNNTKVIDEMSEKIRDEKEAAEKSALLTRIGDYLKHFKEYFPDRVEYLKVPKNLSAKNTVQELRVYVKDLENELGKRGALDYVKMGWVEGLKLFELVNKDEIFGLNVKGLGQVGQASVLPRQTPHGIVPGPVVPTLAEFAIKYGSWFSSSVEARVVMMFFELVSGVHRMNTKADFDVQKAADTPVSKKTDDLMKGL